MTARVPLAHLPTPVQRFEALDRWIGSEVWVKRDDMTGGAEAGNKLRKLEYLVADAERRGARTLITCGGIQSNHARATAIVAARRGLRSLLFLRGELPGTLSGNLLLDRLVGADIRTISPEQYRARSELMLQAAESLTGEHAPGYVIPEGGSNGLGALGYVEAMREVAEQRRLGLCGDRRPFDAIVLACGSGGTAAGVAVGARRSGLAERVVPIAVCDDRSYFEVVIARIVSEMRAIDPTLPEAAELTILDGFKGPAYGIASHEQTRFLVEVARRTGLLLDPVYTGKAMFGLANLDPKPRRVLFLHTGGLPGLLAQASELGTHL